MNTAIEPVVLERASESHRPPARLDNAKLFASWQSGPEKLTGFAQWKLHFELAPHKRCTNNQLETPGERPFNR
jgi:hypothetical protein